VLLAERGPGRAGPAFAVVYQRHERTMLAYFQRRTRSPEIAADLTAETFAQALESRSKFKPRGSGSSVAWLYGIAGHVLARSVRRGRIEDRARARIGVPSLELEDQVLERIAALESDEVVDQALALLPDDQRDAVRARVLGDADYTEIAEALRCSQPAARKRVSRGLATLRRGMEEST
jgi:RNA polymerase sigma factor (sigma-70 family)